MPHHYTPAERAQMVADTLKGRPNMKGQAHATVDALSLAFGNQAEWERHKAGVAGQPKRTIREMHEAQRDRRLGQTIIALDRLRNLDFQEKVA